MAKINEGFSSIVYNGITFYCYKQSQNESVGIISSNHPSLTRLSNFSLGSKKVKAKKNASFFVMSNGEINGSEISNLYDEAVPTSQGFIDVIQKKNGTWAFGNFGYEQYRSSEVKLRYSTGACLLAGGKYSEEYSRACGASVLTGKKIQSCLGIDWDNKAIFITTSPSQSTTPEVLRQFGIAYELQYLFRDDGGGSAELIVDDKIKNGVTAERALPNCLAIIEDSEGEKKGDESLSKKGIDISVWQGDINLAALKNQIDFVIIRLGYSTVLDKKAIRNIELCESLGIPYGLYWYSYARSATAAELEAKAMLQYLGNHKPQYPLYYDIEDSTLPSGETLLQIVETFCNYIEYNGYYSGIYASLSWFNNTNQLNNPRIDKYDKWVAQWSSKCTYSKPYGMWQYTSDGSLNGYSGRLDCNIAYVDYPQTMVNNNLNGYHKDDTDEPESGSDDKPELKTIDEIAKEVLAGIWGNGVARKVALEAAGYNYNEVQAKVNELLNATKLKSIEEVAQEVLTGEWGNGEARKQKLEAAGYNYKDVQNKVNELVAKKSNEEIAKEVIAGLWSVGNERQLRLEASGYDYNRIQAIVNKLLG